MNTMDSTAASSASARPMPVHMDTWYTSMSAYVGGVDCTAGEVRAGHEHSEHSTIKAGHGPQRMQTHTQQYTPRHPNIQTHSNEGRHGKEEALAQRAQSQHERTLQLAVRQL